MVILATVFIGAVTNALPYGCPFDSDYVVKREAYIVGFNADTRNPDWVAYRLTAESLQNPKTKRIDDFVPDPQIPETATLEDYWHSGWSRGHMAPAADMKISVQAMRESFYLSNICPQNDRNNSGAWNRIERNVRDFAHSERLLYVITGPVYFEDQEPRHIGRSRVRVPDAFFKVVFDETAPRKMIAFLSLNRDVKVRPGQLVVTVDEIEELTGFDFFSELPTAEQERLESTSEYSDWESKWRKKR